MIILAWLAGPSALLAAVATIVGAVTLGMFFSKGQPWGTINDVSSIVLMLATLPVVVAVAILQGRSWPLNLAAALPGVVGMLGVATAQALLVRRTKTYEELLPWTLGFGAIVGVWYLFVGVLGLPASDGPTLSLLAIASGVGFVLVGFGFWRGGQQSPIAVASGVLLLITSTAFLAWLGLKIVSGNIGFGEAL